MNATLIFLFLAHFSFPFYFWQIFMQGEKITYLHVQHGVTIEKGPVNGDGRRPLVNTIQIPVNTVQMPYKKQTNTAQSLHKYFTNIIQLYGLVNGDGSSQYCTIQYKYFYK